LGEKKSSHCPCQELNTSHPARSLVYILTSYIATTTNCFTELEATWKMTVLGFIRMCRVSVSAPNTTNHRLQSQCSASRFPVYVACRRIIATVAGGWLSVCSFKSSSKFAPYVVPVLCYLVNAIFLYSEFGY